MLYWLLGAVAGVALQLQQAALWQGAAYLMLLIAGVIATACTGVTRNRLAGISSLTAGGFCLLAGCTGLHALQMQSRILHPELEGRSLNIVGRVADLPRVEAHSVQFELEIESAQQDSQPVWVPPRVQIGWGESRGEVKRDARDDPDEIEDQEVTRRLDRQVRAGQRWSMTVRMQRPHGLSNPGGFDTELWFWERGVGASAWVQQGRQANGPRLLDAGNGWSLVEWRQSARDAIFRKVTDKREAGVLAALVVGDQASIDSPTWEIFRLTGVAHLISISGLHVTMFAAMAFWIVGACWRLAGRVLPGLLHRLAAPRAAAIGGMLLALAYAAFAGWGVPAQRTVLMLAVVMVLRLSARRWPLPIVWLLVMVVVLLWDPWAMLQAGFWLSFVAVGVLFVSSAGTARTKTGWRSKILDLLRTQAVVTLALAPLTWLLFGQTSVVGLLANLAAIPWVTLLVTPLALLGVLIPWLWPWAAMAVGWMTSTLELLARLSWAAWERPMVPAILAWTAVAAGVLLVLRLPWTVRAWGLLIAWPALVFWPVRPVLGEFELLAADVGQGSAIIVRTAAHTLLFDTGPVSRSGRNAVQGVLLPLFRGANERPDLIVVSHDDIDHAGGLETLAQRFPSAQWMASFDTTLRGGRLSHRCEAGQQWTWDGVDFDVLHPLASDHGTGASDNAMSCVLRIRASSGHYGSTALLTGDMGVKQEVELLQREPGLNAHLLVVAHHGSASSTGNAWLQTLRPRMALIQAGHRNRYRHPAPQVLRRLADQGVYTYASPSCGAALWSSMRPDTVQCERGRAPRYWQYRHPSIDPDQRD